jgi:acetyl-CoA C-acetyltransferase
VGVYSTKPAAWKGGGSEAIQAEISSWPAPSPAPEAALEGTVETYTIDYGREAPAGIVVCRTPADERFIAVVEDQALVSGMIASDPLGARVTCRRDDKGRRVVTALVG